MAKIESLSDLDDYKKQKRRESKMKKYSKVFAIFFTILFSIIIGFVVYKVVDKAINKDQSSDQEYLGESIDLNDVNVQILYEYVTYGAEGTRNLKFVTNRNVDLSSFTAKEKIYYALQFVQPSDFELTSEVNQQNQKIYILSDRVIQNKIKLFFGNEATYEQENYIEYPFSFYIEKMNAAKMTYDRDNLGYDVVFDSYYDINKNLQSPQPVYGQLISALRQPDGSIVLQERVVYTETKTTDGSITMNIYKDPEKTQLLETKNNLSESDLANLTIDFSKYTTTAIVEYTFGWNGQNCYFSKSRIIL